MLVAHEEINENLSGDDQWYKTLLPQKIPFISYPYEWSFDMLKDAALLSLQLVKECLPFGVMLKDASPYNVQWLNGKAVFIDTLSFEKYEPSKPWIAYRQFCESFLSPLLLMHYTGQPLQSMLLAWPDGIPLPVTRSLLPWRSRFSFHTYLHIHLHGSLASKASGKELTRENNFTEKKLKDLISSLQSLVTSLHWKERPTTWSHYYKEAEQRGDYLEQKKNIIAGWLNEMPGIKSAVDLGANEGEFSYLLAGRNIQIIATDLDHNPVNVLYKRIRTGEQKNILPLVIDLSNPSPANGLNNKERSSFIERTSVDLALALALVHHLAIGKNVPFEKIAALFQSLANYLIIEFIQKQDEKLQVMLKQKKDIYPGYTEENFVKAFEKFFSVQKKQAMGNSNRILYLMKNRSKS